jgi:hypothetical protein
MHVSQGFSQRLKASETARAGQNQPGFETGSIYNTFCQYVFSILFFQYCFKKILGTMAHLS